MLNHLGSILPYVAKVLLARLVWLGAQIEILNDVKVSSLPSSEEAASEGRLSGVRADGGQWLAVFITQRGDDT